MPKKVKPVPKGHSGVTPYLSVQGASDAIRFYKKVFGAREVTRMRGPEGAVMHAELEIGGVPLMLADEFPQAGFRSPKSVGGTAVTLHLYVEKVDKVFARAVKAGATVTRPVADQFYGDRSGQFQDPFGHLWHVSSRVQKLSTKEMRRRSQEFAKQQAAPR